MIGRCALVLLVALPGNGAAGSPGQARAGKTAKRPNVLLILVDDLKPALGAYGDRLAKSPNIDRLAKRGVLFERAYANQAVCAPSRNALLTGLRPTSTGVYDLGTNFRLATPDAVTLPQWFMQQGYRAEGLGKVFHVGHGNHEDAASWSVPHWKTDVVAYALPGSGAPQGPTREEALFGNTPAAEARRLPRGAAYEAADVPDDAYPDGRLAEEAVRRLRHAKASPDRPFFLALGFVKPHLPFCAPKKYWDLYDRDAFTLPVRRTPPDGAPPYAPQFGGELRQYREIPEEGALDDELQRTLIHGYYAATSYADAQVGRVLDELDRLQLADDTIVVLWGDHGWHLGDHGMWCKHTNYEQAARIPLVVSAPDMRNRGMRSAALVETVDIYPTLSELAGWPEPGVPQGLDGISFARLLDQPGSSTREAVFHAYPREVPSRGGALVGRAVRTERYRLVEWKQPGAPPGTAEMELYDYETDPGETRNLAADQPAVVGELRARLAAQGEAKPPLRPPAP
ncbi:MAG TPA: sulfatase [Vicinamibacteria bacterium]|nr:sulfatase [Vicinamibacteria bacterium]